MMTAQLCEASERSQQLNGWHGAERDTGELIGHIGFTGDMNSHCTAAAATTHSDPQKQLRLSLQPKVVAHRIK